MRMTIAFFLFLWAPRVMCEPRSPLESIVRLSSRTTGACGSGVILRSGMIATASHLARRLCRYGVCENVALASAERLRTAPREVPLTGRLRVAHDIPSLDVALLELVDQPPLRGAFEEPGDVTVGGSVTALGYPHCGVLEATVGEVSGADAVSVTASARGAPGSSGGVLVDERQRVVGITIEIATASGSLVHAVFGSLVPLRASRYAVVRELVEREPASSLRHEADLLNRYHEEVVSPTDGRSRLFRSSDFMAMVHGFTWRLSMAPIDHSSLSRILFLLESYPSPPRESPSDELGAAAEELLLRYSFERFGPFRAFLTPMDPGAFSERIGHQGRDDTQTRALQRLVERVAQSRYQGYELMLLTTCLFLGCFTLPILLAWAWSLGYVWARTEGGVVYKAWIIAVVALLLWPLSLFAFRKKLQREKKRRARIAAPE